MGEQDRDLELQRDREHRIAVAKNQGIVPALEALAVEMERRAESGQLKKELKKMKVANLIHNMTKIIAAIKANGPVVVVAGRAASQDKPPEWFRAHSVANMTDMQKALLRAKILKGEIVDEGKPESEQPKETREQDDNGSRTKDGTDEGQASSRRGEAPGPKEDLAGSLPDRKGGLSRHEDIPDGNSVSQGSPG